MLARIAAAIAAAVAVGCGAADADGPGGAGDVADWELRFDTELACYIDPNADSDGDGLLDIIEDANRNCTVDPGETDPNNPDTDGDGLLDGDEDVDGNGIWDAERGEFNPLVADTDGNGVPDGLEPRRFVCNRQRAQELLSARVVLASGMTLLRHPSWTRVRPIDARTALVVGERQPEGAGVLGVVPSAVATLDDVVRGVNDIIRDDVRLSFAGRTQSLDRRQSLARWTVTVERPDQPAALEAALTQIGDLMGLTLANAELPLPAARDLELQIARQERGTVVVWALAIATIDYAPLWLNAIHPQAVAPSADARARLYCEDLHQRTVPDLNVVVVGANVAETLASDVSEALSMLVTTRSAEGLSTRIQVVSSLAHELGAVGVAQEVPPAQLKEALLQLGAGADERPLMHAAAALESLSGGGTAGGADEPVEPTSGVLLVVLSHGEDSELREGTLQGWDGNPELPPRQADDPFRLAREQAYAVRFRRVAAHVIGLGGVGVGCSSDDTGAQEASLAVERVSVGAGGFFVSSCLDELVRQLVAVPLRPLSVPAYDEPRRDAVWGTLLVATEDGERYPGAFGLQFGRPVLGFPEAFGAPVAPVSYTAWD